MMECTEICFYVILSPKYAYLGNYFYSIHAESYQSSEGHFCSAGSYLVVKCNQTEHILRPQLLYHELQRLLEQW